LPRRRGERGEKPCALCVSAANLFHTMKSLFQLFFFLLIFSAPKISFAIGDTIPSDTTAKYDLWDPRNPNCPCHQYQKLADEEYARLHAQNNNPSDSSNQAVVVSNDTTYQNKNFVSTSTGSSKRYSSTRKSQREIARWMRKAKRCCAKKSKGTKKGKHRLASCFHFN